VSSPFDSGIVAVLAPSVARNVRHWFIHLGAWGLIPLGLLDISIIPLPGIMDLVTIILCARDAHWWPYYALMATAGSVIGGFVTYRLARKGGKAMLSRRFSRKALIRVYKMFERSGFAAIAIPAVLPPPAPMVAFLFAAGAMQYPVRKFLAALTLGRLVRYTILAYLGARYGRHILNFFSSHALLIGVAGLAAFLVTSFFTVRGKR
jgi:membrane protein YqaA with SNARE-associated domain